MTQKPNILIIFPDQLRRYAAGYWSDPKYRKHVIGEPDPAFTPNIDKLAREGMVFTDAISNTPVCSPHRGMMLSGMFPEKNGLMSNCHVDAPYALKRDIQTITDIFHAADYSTSYFGKCHWVQTLPHFDVNGRYTGDTDSPGGHFINKFDTYVPPGPDRHHIDYFFQTINDGHFNPIVYSNDPAANDGKPDGEPSRPKQLSTKIETKTIIDYLDNTRGQRDPDKPFFAIWSINPPHGSWADEHVETQYRDQHYNETLFPENTDLLVRKNLIPNANEAVTHVRNYFAAVTSVDHYVGRVIDHLRSNEALNNTIILFTSDHGEYLGSHQVLGKHGPQVEAFGVPFIVSWPEHIQAGIDTNMIGVPDILPTLLGLVDLEGHIPKTVQGRNMASLLIDGKASSCKRSDDALLCFFANNRRGLVTRSHVLVIDRGELRCEDQPDDYFYDLINDPYQTKKIPIEDQLEVSDRLLHLLTKRLEEADDMWFREKRYGDTLPW